MAADRIIDLDRELADLFTKEEMLAFFDFRLVLNGDEALSGLCKISEPKRPGDKSTYFSLFFVTDIPDQKMWTEIDALMSKIPWDRFQRYLPHVESVMSLPIHKPIHGVYLRETYVYVNGPLPPLGVYLTNQLYPAIIRVTGFQAGELVIWSEIADMMAPLKAAADAAASKDKPVPTFLERLGRLLK